MNTLTRVRNEWRRLRAKLGAQAPDYQGYVAGRRARACTGPVERYRPPGGHYRDRKLQAPSRIRPWRCRTCGLRMKRRRPDGTH